MTQEIATLIRFLRVEHKVGCEAVAYYLSDTKPSADFFDYHLGRALCEIAAHFLHEKIEDWPP